AQNVGGTRPKGNAESEFVRPLGNSVGENAVHSHGGQNESYAPEDRHQDADYSDRRNCIADFLLQRMNLFEGLLGINSPNSSPHEANDLYRILRSSNHQIGRTSG